jgi:hypothetical protein
MFIYCPPLSLVIFTVLKSTLSKISIGTCVSQTLPCCDKVPDINNLMRGRFILAHGFRGFTPSRLAVLLLGLW